MKKKSRCWKGYKPTPGKKPFSKGSCTPVSESFSKIFQILETERTPKEKQLPLDFYSGYFKSLSPKDVASIRAYIRTGGKMGFSKEEGEIMKKQKPKPKIQDSIERIGILLNEKVKRAERVANALYNIRIRAKGTEAESSTRVAHLGALEKIKAAKDKQAKRLARKGKTRKDAEAIGVEERYKKKIIPKNPDNVEDSIQRIGDLITEVAAWQRKEGKNPSGGLNKKGVASYRKENPGSKLKTAVTTKPSKLKKGSRAAKRRKSFCARMQGLKSKLTSKKTAGDPNSRVNKSLRKWNC